MVSMAQKGKKFKKLESGLTFKRSYLLKRIDSVKAILFVYEGSADFTYAFNYMSDKLRMRFKKRYQVGFEYNLTYNEENQYLSEWIKPTPKLKEQHQMICKVRLFDVQFKRHKKTPHVQHSYKILIELIDPKTNELAELNELELKGYAPFKRNKHAVVEAIDRVIKGHKRKLY